MSAWLDAMRRTAITEVAARLGVPTGPRLIGTCPLCGASRPPLSSGKLPRSGGSGCGVHATGLGARCFKCNESFDALDLAALTLRGKRFRDLGEGARAEVRAWCCDLVGVDAGSTRPPSSMSTPRTERPTMFGLSPRTELETEREPATTPPPIDELRALWDGCICVDRDPRVVAYLRERALNPGALADRGFVRALYSRTPVFAWSRLGYRTWYASEHRLITLLYDAGGVARSCIARRITSEEPKGVSPRGHTRAGLVLADELGERVLRHGTHPSKWPAEPQQDVPFDLPCEQWWPADEPLRIVITEGEIDMWAWSSTTAGDAVEHPPAVFGVVQGSWTDAIASRIPDGSYVTIGTDLDAKGEDYFAKIVETFRDRDLTVRRWRPSTELQAARIA
jgi:hypothetical protein